VTGQTRYWDKLVCAGELMDGTIFGLIYDSKGQDHFTVYRLHNTTVAGLYSGSAS
jgi:hypothetical protein